MKTLLLPLILVSICVNVDLQAQEDAPTTISELGTCNFEQAKKILMQEEHDPKLSTVLIEAIDNVANAHADITVENGLNKIKELFLTTFPKVMETTMSERGLKKQVLCSLVKCIYKKITVIRTDKDRVDLAIYQIMKNDVVPAQEGLQGHKDIICLCLNDLGFTGIKMNQFGEITIEIPKKLQISPEN